MEKRSINKFSFENLGEFLPSSLTLPKSKFEVTEGDSGCFLSAEDIETYSKNGDFFIELPLYEGEDVYGMGLMFKGVRHTLTSKRLKPNSDPIANTGDSHAPVPFFVSTRGYGVLADSCSIVSFHFGSANRRIDKRESRTEDKAVITNVSELYERKETKESKIIIQFHKAEGGQILIFSGGDILNSVSLYNLYSGGGCMPALWGMGNIYRVYGGASEKDAREIASSIRREEIPCDIIGLEPGWQTHAYSCSLKVNEKSFPTFYDMIDSLKRDGYHVNLWEHIFLHSTCPIYEKLFKYSGDYEVWEGIVPDFTIADCENIFMDYIEELFISKGIDGFKLDECDDSDYSTNWSFPSFTSFPGGLNGEEMHILLGGLLQKMFDKVMKKRNTRYLSQVRSSGANASSFSFALYTDLYSYDDYLRGVVNCGFSGLLFSPEVRQCDSSEEFIRRLELMVFSPAACINAWMIPSPPWKQFDIEKNVRGEMLKYDSLTKKCKDILDLRMKFLPVMYNLFYRYNTYGEPPYRAMVMNYPLDERARTIDNQFMLGTDIIIAPIDYSSEQREVYLPEGNWYDFFTFEKHTSGKIILTKDSPIGVFIKEGTLLPIAKPKVNTKGVFEMELLSFGENTKAQLFEDDGETYDYLQGKFNIVDIAVSDNKYTVCRNGNFEKENYVIKSLTVI